MGLKTMFDVHWQKACQHEKFKRIAMFWQWASWSCYTAEGYDQVMAWPTPESRTKKNIFECGTVGTRLVTEAFTKYWSSALMDAVVHYLPSSCRQILYRSQYYWYRIMWISIKIIIFHRKGSQLLYAWLRRSLSSNSSLTTSTSIGRRSLENSW